MFYDVNICWSRVTYSVLQEKLLLWEKSLVCEFVTILTWGKEYYICIVELLLLLMVNFVILFNLSQSAGIPCFSSIYGLKYPDNSIFFFILQLLEDLSIVFLFCIKFKRVEFDLETDLQMVEPKISNVWHYFPIVMSMDFSGVLYLLDKSNDWHSVFIFKLTMTLACYNSSLYGQDGIPAETNGVAALRHNWQHQVCHIFISVFTLLLIGVGLSEELFVAADANVLECGLTRPGYFTVLFQPYYLIYNWNGWFWINPPD